MSAATERHALHVAEPQQPPGLVTAPHSSGQPGGPPDTCYLLGRHGFIYCGRRGGDDYTVRQLGVILLSVEEASFVLCRQRQPDLLAAAAAVAPLVSRRLVPGESAVLRLNVSPGHPCYPALSGLRGAGAMALKRSAYNAFNDGFRRVRDGTATVDEAESIFQQVLACTAPVLPPGYHLPRRAQEMTSLLDERPGLSLEDLAAHYRQAPKRLSRAFRTMVGMSVRDYKEFARGQRLMDLLHTARSLTEVALEAGFRDSSQLSHAVHRWFGCSPSYLRNPKYVRVFRRGN